MLRDSESKLNKLVSSMFQNKTMVAFHESMLAIKDCYVTVADLIIFENKVKHMERNAFVKLVRQNSPIQKQLLFIKINVMLLAQNQKILALSNIPL